MEIDLLGKVHEKKLAYSNTLLPLYEAIVNSIHAIEEECTSKPGIIEIELRRSTQQQIPVEGSEIANPIIDFIITDNGVGFNSTNYESFNFAHSTYKFNRGGKGIGRITWLRAFERAKIESVFKENSIYKIRKFSFERSKRGIENHELIDLQGNIHKRYTKVHLNGLKEDYQKWCNNKIEDIALKIIEHCFSYFLNDHCPRIILIDDQNTLVVNDLFRLYIRNSVDHKELKIRNEKFYIDIVKLYSPKPDNKIHFRAHNREVYSKKISDYIPEINRHLLDINDEKFSICIYISGEYLDLKVNEERTEITFSKIANSLFPDEISEEDILKAVLSEIRNKFNDYIEQFSNANLKRISEFVKEHPRYRFLSKYKKDKVKGVSSTLSDAKLEIELFKIQQELDFEIVCETKERLSNGNFNLKEDDDLYLKITEVGSAKLAEYVLHRKKILDFFEEQLKLSKEGKYTKEEMVHQLIFPLRKTSDDVFLEEHNLWILDERLSFHDYLASDLSFRSIDKTTSRSQKEPDIIIFSHPHVLHDEKKPYNSIVIIEFKRPMRNDYSETENPINQINKYVREILNNQAKDKFGRFFDLRDGTPIFAYIVCDITPNLGMFADDQNFTKMPDSGGYFSFNRTYNLYIEIISFDKLLSDANKRNKILFEKLNIPTSK